MKKLIILLIFLALCLSCFGEEISRKPADIFPDVEPVALLPHTPGDTAAYAGTVSLYSMKNANYYFDAYFALVKLHNVSMADARLLVEVNYSLNEEVKVEKKKVGQSFVRGTVIGAAVGVVVYAIIRR